LWLQFLVSLGHQLTCSASDVHVLNNDNFDTFVAEHPISLIEFYAPWCGHCKQLTPKWEEAATALKGVAPLAKVDCTGEDSQDVCSKFGVRGYPTLKVFRNSGEPTDYDKGRDVPSIVSFMKKQTQPAFVVISDEEGLTKFKETSLGVVAFLSALSGADYDEFIAAANAERNNYEFAVTDSAKLAASVGASVPSVVLFRNFDEPQVVHTGAITTLDVLKFVSSESFPLLGDINAETYQKYMERGLPLFYIFVDPSAAVTKTVSDAARAAAAAFKGQLSFVTLDGVKWERFMSGTFSIKTLPAAAIHQKKKIYLHSGDIDTASLTAQAKAFLDGSLAPLFKSQEIPASNDEPVKVLVGKNFEKIVFDETKDVFVEFYAPWCGHCKSLAPIYDEVGTHFVGTPSVVVAKIDSTENDSPADVSGFPTLIYYPAGNKAGITFSGDRTKSAIIDFIVQHGSEATKNGAPAHSHSHEEL